MSVTLHQMHSPAQRIDLRGILPAALASLDESQVRRQPVYAGKRRYTLGDLFEVRLAQHDPEILIIEPLDGRIDRIGAGLDHGHIQVNGSAGDLAGAGMSGGSLRISGHAGDHAGAGMGGGQLRIDGNSGDFTAAPLPGERRGQHGGVLWVRGSSGQCAGECMRRGLLIIEGDAGERLGYRMIAGTIYCGGRAGDLAGYGMRRGTLLLRTPARSLSRTAIYNGSHKLPFLPLLLHELHGLLGHTGNPPKDVESVQRYVGDLACDGRGEILVIG